jgi:hypothetical protein
LILPGNNESPERVVEAKDVQPVPLDVKRRTVIDIIERFQRAHALQEEREVQKLPPSAKASSISCAPDKKGIPQQDIFENEQVRVSTMSVPKGIHWSVPQDGRDRVVVFLDKINPAEETNEKDSFSSSAWRVTRIPANTEVNVPNNSDQTRDLMILEFKDTRPLHCLN